MKAFCPDCNKEQNYNVRCKNEKLLGYPMVIVNCDICNEKLYINEIIEANVKSFNNYMNGRRQGKMRYKYIIPEKFNTFLEGLTIVQIKAYEYEYSKSKKQAEECLYLIKKHEDNRDRLGKQEI